MHHFIIHMKALPPTSMPICANALAQRNRNNIAKTWRVPRCRPVLRSVGWAAPPQSRPYPTNRIVARSLVCCTSTTLNNHAIACKSIACP